ncbi:MAG: MauE/DoxX family redox-associated membrane protein, partial [Gammaproteobacteria bacterium]
MLVDPTIAVVLRIAFALLFITAAVSKLDGQRFRALLQAYRLLPESLLGTATRALPVLELALGIGWALGVMSMPVALLSIALLGSYSLAMAVNLLRGNDNIDCGCGFGKSG